MHDNWVLDGRGRSWRSHRIVCRAHLLRSDTLLSLSGREWYRRGPPVAIVAHYSCASLRGPLGSAGELALELNLGNQVPGPQLLRSLPDETD
jgi:hypothetical protein